MKICMPVAHNEGLASEVFQHFGSAPLFLVMDTETQEVEEIRNRDLHHAHGACSPLKALGGHRIDAVIVGGIGAGALRGLEAAGIRVYRSEGGTAADNLSRLSKGTLVPYTPLDVCGGHGHGHGCSA